MEQLSQLSLVCGVWTEPFSMSPPGKQIWKPKHVRELGEELGTSSTGIPGVGENRLQALLHRFPWDEEQSMSFWGLGFFNHSHSLRSAPFLAYPGSSLKVVF